MLAQISAGIHTASPAPLPNAAGESPYVRKKSANRVLVVDDEPLVRWSITEMLASRGFDTAQAADAHEALAVIGDPTLAPDVVLLDLKLPDSDDLRVLTALRLRVPKAPVILMTAFGTPELVEEARRLGAACVLDKPFDLDALESVIDWALCGDGAAPPVDAVKQRRRLY